MRLSPPEEPTPLLEVLLDRLPLIALDRDLHLCQIHPELGADGAQAVVALIQQAVGQPASQPCTPFAEQQLLSVLDNLFAFVGVLEPDGTLIHANQAPLLAAGIAIDDVRGRKFWDCHWWQHDEQARAQLMQAVERCREGQTSRYDVAVRMKGDARMWIDFMLAPLRDSGGHITHLIPSGMDISQRHRSESALYESEQRYLSVIESSDDAIITKSLQGIITSWNPAASRLLGYSAQQAIGQPITMLFPPDKLAEEVEVMRQISAGQRVATFETVRIHQSGRRIDVAITISPLRDRTGAVIGACKLARDITLQRQQRELLQHALSEKTALLQEVHHRVKNNLQIVSSLLNLQARKVAPDAASAIAECQGRIRAMGLVHQLLYESGHLAGIDLSDYLERLVALIATTFGMAANGIEVRFTSTSGRTLIGLQRIIPCGLLVNELVLNAFKHAFAGRSRGLIEVALAKDRAGTLHLRVSDDGCGLPPGFDWTHSGGLGGQLIPMFVQQLTGRMDTRSSSAGASFTLELDSQAQEN